VILDRASVVKITAGEKTQMRLPVKPNETYSEVMGIVYKGNRIKFQTGNTYSLQMRLGWETVNKIRITDIRSERACDITEQNAIAEGAKDKAGFLKNWEISHGYRALGAMVWVLSVEPLFTFGQSVALVKCTHYDMRHIQLPAKGVLALNNSIGSLFWVEINRKLYCVPIGWLSTDSSMWV